MSSMFGCIMVNMNFPFPPDRMQDAAEAAAAEAEELEGLDEESDPADGAVVPPPPSQGVKAWVQQAADRVFGLFGSSKPGATHHLPILQPLVLRCKQNRPSSPMYDPDTAQASSEDTILGCLRPLQGEIR